MPYVHRSNGTRVYTLDERLAASQAHAHAWEAVDPRLPASTPPEPAQRVQPAPQLTVDIDELYVVKPSDEAALRHIAQHVTHPRFWTDDMLMRPLDTFAFIYMNPANFVVLAGAPPGDGVVAYVRSAQSWRAAFYGIAWGRTAMRRPLLWRTATASAFRALDLYALDGITAWDNLLARRAMEVIGFTQRARIPKLLSYRGAMIDAAWYELSRDAVEDASYLTL